MATATSNDLFAVMLSKERLVNQTSGVQVNNVNIQDKPTVAKGAKFCLYHSYNGNTSTHNTEDCNHIKRGLTYKSLTSKFHRHRTTDEHYTAPSAAQKLQYKKDLERLLCDPLDIGVSRKRLQSARPSAQEQLMPCQLLIEF